MRCIMLPHKLDLKGRLAKVLNKTSASWQFSFCAIQICTLQQGTWVHTPGNLTDLLPNCFNSFHKSTAGRQPTLFKNCIIWPWELASACSYWLWCKWTEDHRSSFSHRHTLGTQSSSAKFHGHISTWPESQILFLLKKNKVSIILQRAVISERGKWFFKNTPEAVEGKSETSLPLILSPSIPQNPSICSQRNAARNNLQFLSHLYIYIEIYTETYKI